AAGLAAVHPAPGEEPLRPEAAEAVRRLARRSGILSIDLLDGSGRIRWSTLSSRVGEEGPPENRNASGDPIGSEPGFFRAPVTSRFTYLAQGSHRWRLQHPVEGFARTGWQLRTLAWIQGAAILVALVAVLRFARWALDPYRRLARGVRRAAGEETRPAPVADLPEFLLDSFRGVMVKLAAQEREIERLRREADPPLRGAWLEGMKSGFFLIRADGRIAEANPAAAALFGMAAPDLVGRDFREAIPVDGLRAILRRALEGREAISREVIPVRRPDGAAAHFGVSASPLLDAGRERGAILLVTDLTEIQEVEARVRKRDALATVGEWSAGVAHEFRNRLGTILALVRLLGRGLAPAGRETADDLIEEIAGAGRTVDDFLQFARPARVRTEPVELQGLLLRAAARAEAEFPGRIEVRVEGEFPAVPGDPALLLQAFHNLLRNAAETGPGGDPVRVGIRVAPGAPPGRVRVEIHDSGPGIRVEDLQDVFTPFFTTKAGGTGLGLPLARKIFLNHDGDLRVERPPDAGTRFLAELPVLPAPIALGAGSSRPGAGAGPAPGSRGNSL
ncbi:MAG: PAS domain-containing protein, partial [Acidobacteria bacterium]|nr:PAS domain-containing protein [Acidobacteriota bacterium]